MRTQLRCLSVLALSLAACGGGQKSLGLTSSADNDSQKVQAALSQLSKRAQGPMNSLGKPLAFLVARDKGEQELIAYDLAAKKELWRKRGDVDSRVVVSRDIVSFESGEGNVTAIAIADGQLRWNWNFKGEFVGAEADAAHVYVTLKSEKAWDLVALDATSGTELWRVDANGALGGSAATGGLVFSPYLKQWLSIIDAKTGKQLARIRGIDEEISFVRADADGIFFGSKQGITLVDKKAASGKRDDSTYASVALPAELPRLHYHWDAFDPVQSGYSAYDRNRILWEATPAQGGGLSFQDDRVVVHAYRFFFGLEAGDGSLAWAYSHPRVDLVASAHEGSSIAFLSMLGELGALDPKSGQRIYSSEVNGQFLGATFDARGWAPSESEISSESTAAALASIAGDKDARFAEVKSYAVAELSKIDSPDTSTDLISIIQNPKTPPSVYREASQRLVSRKDPKALPKLLSSLSKTYSYTGQQKPHGLGPLAHALREMVLDPNIKVSPKDKELGLQALKLQVESPETSHSDLAQILKSYAAIGNESQVSEISALLMLSRVEGAYAKSDEVARATIDALLEFGGLSGREFVAFVSQDKATSAKIVAYASESLARKESDNELSESAQDAPKSASVAKPKSSK